MRNGLQRSFFGLFMLLSIACLSYTHRSQAACTPTTTASSPTHYVTLGDCGDKASAQAACFDFVTGLGFSTSHCGLGGYPGYAGMYGAGWLSSGGDAYLGNFYFCHTENHSYAFVKDHLEIYRWLTQGSACSVLPPEVVVKQTAKAICSQTMPASGPDRLEGNPVDCTTGLKSQREVDYADADFKVERTFSAEELAGTGSQGWRLPKPQLSVTQVLGHDVAVFTYGSWQRAFIRPIGTTDWLSSRFDDGWLVEIGGLPAFREPSGRVFEFNATGTLTAISEADGRRLNVSNSTNGLGGTTETYTHNLTGRSYKFVTNAAHQIVEFVDPAGKHIVYTWDSLGRLTTVTYPDDTPASTSDNPTRQYLYEDSTHPRLLTGIIDENGDRYATYGYDAQGRAILSEHAGGTGRVAFDYLSSTQTRVRRYYDASRYTEKLISYAPYSNNGLRVNTIQYGGCPDCNLAVNTETFTYDSAGWLNGKVDKRGIATHYTFAAASGLETSRTEATGTTQSRTINTIWTNSNPARRITALQTPGREHYFYYNSNRQLTDAWIYTYSGTRITNYSYDPANRLSTINGPRTDASDVTNLGYDSQSNVSQITNALGQAFQITHYNAVGQPLRILDPNGVETLLTYDARQHLLSSSTAGETTSFEYDKAGQLKKIITPDGAWLAYTYDAAHRLTGVADQDGHRVEYSLDWAGNRLSEKVYGPGNVLRRSQTRVYDGLSRLKEIQGANGQITSFLYDGNDNLVSLTVDSRTTAHQYDSLNRVIKTIDPTAGEIRYVYNIWDETIGVTDPRNLITSYARNYYGEVTQLQSPDTGTSNATYDSAGNLKTRTDAKGQVVTYSYDALNRVTQAVYTGGPTVTYSYDAGPYGKGRLTGIGGPGASLAWTYTAHGRVASQTQVVGARTLVTHYSYDSAGRLASQTLPSGKVVGYSWTLNRLTGVTLDGNPVASNLAHEPFGGVSQWDFANGQPVQKSFDLSGRMTAHSLGTLGYDTADRITGLAHGGLSQLTGTKTYGYDALDRLTSYLGASFGIGYSYDANGNRTQQSGSGGTLDYTISSTSNRLDSLTDGTTTQSFSYDANGSLTADGLHTYGYDKTGRLASLDGSTAYAYNGLGQRVGKTASGTGTVYAYDEAGHLVGEYDAATGNPIQETIWMGDTPIAVVKGSGTYYVHADHLNTPRQINDQAGDPVWVWDTITFGSSSPDEDPLSTGTPFVYNLRFPGQYYDAETGLHYNWNRYYNTLGGRYNESDRIGLAGGLNTYAYVEGNPLNYTDPTGNCPLCLVPLAAGAAWWWSQQGGLSTPHTTLPAMPPLPIGLPGVNVGICAISPATCAIAMNEQQGDGESCPVSPEDVSGKTPEEIDRIAKEKGLVPKGPDPQNGKGAYVDPVTGKQRVLVHPSGNPFPHAHVNNPAGERLGVGGTVVAPESPEAHLPIRHP